MKLLSTKIFAGYLLVICLLTGLILFFTFQTIRHQYLDTFAGDLKNINITLHKQIKPFMINGNYSELDAYVKEVGKQIKTRITVIDFNGKVIADSKRNPVSMENHKGRPEVKDAFNGAYGQALRFSTTVHDEMLYVALPVIDHNSNKMIGVIRVSLYLKQINSLTSKLAFDIIQIAVIVVFLSLIGVLIFSRNISKPLNLLSLASHKVAMGDFDAKVYLKGRDEIKELADNFNNMTEKLKELFDQVMSQKEELNTLIRTIQEPLAVLDLNGTILLANKSFSSVFAFNDNPGIHYTEVIPEEGFDSIFKQAVLDKKSFTQEIEISNDFFICSANYIESKKEVVLLLHNITEIKKLEKMKKDFVVNVSHELRTPLTAIKGFVETLEDETDGETELHYISIIKRHTNRLINIVQDLLILSELEEPSSTLMLSKVDIRFLCDNVVKIFEQKITEKNLELVLDIQSDFPKMKVDTFRMEQVFVNLIDNAIKYTDAGNVNIKVNHDGKNVCIQISDSGVGITKEDQKRIFERFYIADKSRSRKVGGTGLGLSIVKHIVLLHNGEINVFSEPGKGTTFKIILPLDPEKVAD